MTCQAKALESVMLPLPMVRTEQVTLVLSSSRLQTRKTLGSLLKLAQPSRTGCKGL